MSSPVVGKETTEQYTGPISYTFPCPKVMPLVYRQCRYSGEVLPTSEFTIDHWDCDKVCQAPPFGPKSTPVEESYSVRQEANITESFEETYNDEDRPAWQALFDFVDADQSGLTDTRLCCSPALRLSPPRLPLVGCVSLAAPCPVPPSQHGRTHAECVCV